MRNIFHRSDNSRIESLLSKKEGIAEQLLKNEKSQIKVGKNKKKVKGAKYYLGHRIDFNRD